MKRPTLPELPSWLAEQNGWCGTPYLIVAKNKLVAMATEDEFEEAAVAISRSFGESKVYVGEMLVCTGNAKASLEGVYRHGQRQ